MNAGNNDRITEISHQQHIGEGWGDQDEALHHIHTDEYSYLGASELGAPQVPLRHPRNSSSSSPGNQSGL